MGIRVQDVSKRFGAHRVLDRVSLEVAPGELFVLLGASGSGKSTLLRLIAGLTTPDEGCILLSGRDVTGVRPQRRGTGFVFQNYSVFRHMTVAQNIEFGLRVRGVPRAERQKRREALLDLVGLPGFGDREAIQLSGGQQQRVAIARALAYEPKVLLLDEPFGALDVKIRHQLRRSLRAIHDRLMITTVLVTHDQDEAFELADRVGLMDRGRLVEVGRAEDLYARPRTLFASTFLGSGTVLMGRMRGGHVHFEGLDIGVRPPAPFEEGSPAYLLLRPEDLTVSSAQPPEGQPTLGSGTVVEQRFAGALRRVRVQLARRAEVHPASSPAPRSEGVLVEALLPPQQELPEKDVWVTMQRWHFLDPPPASLLVADDGRGPAGRLEIARYLARALEARITLLGVAVDARHSERLGWSLHRRQRAAGLEEAELRVRYGNAGAQILHEQDELLSQMIVFPARPRPAWIDRFLGNGGKGMSRTMSTVLEGARVPVLIASGRSRPLRRAMLVKAPEQKTADAQRFLARLARPLAMQVSDLVADLDSTEPLDSSGTDLIVVPVVRRGPLGSIRIRPRIARLLASCDRPVLLVPTTEPETKVGRR
ncbi:MAG TPA: ATP-binding cassette domain-containing protein [Candidatus Eisenbacteria bacterium]|nr:ATP-binding cassette domain-containing protein [Candidatus Eisenbacteria bacterium]